MSFPTLTTKLGSTASTNVTDPTGGNTAPTCTSGPGLLAVAAALADASTVESGIASGMMGKL